MGYTHYFDHTEVSQEVWDKIVNECRQVCKSIEHSVPIEDDFDGSYPQFDDEYIRFNGVGDDAHETFLLERDGSEGFTFCKTAQKPYDLAVTACLLIYKKHSPDTMHLTSDGDDEDWMAAKELIDG